MTPRQRGYADGNQNCSYGSRVGKYWSEAAYDAYEAGYAAGEKDAVDADARGRMFRAEVNAIWPD